MAIYVNDVLYATNLDKAQVAVLVARLKARQAGEIHVSHA